MNGEIKRQVVQAHIDNPTWTSVDIAKAIGASPSTVRGIVGDTGIVLPSQRLKDSLERARTRPFKRVRYAGKDRNDGGRW